MLKARVKIVSKCISQFLPNFFEHSYIDLYSEIYYDGTMQVNKSIVVFIILLVFIVLAANIYFFAQLSKPTPLINTQIPTYGVSSTPIHNTKNSQLAKVNKVTRPTIPPFKTEFKSNEKIWPSYTNTQFNYSISYPPEFTINPRGKVGNYLDMIGLLYEYQNKKYTILTIGVVDTPAPEKQMTVQQQLDNNMYPLTQYIFPYPNGGNKMQISVTGFVYPSTNLNHTFSDVINRVGLSLQIQK